MRTAIVHHWFLSGGGGERVAAAIAAMFPEADLFTLFLDEKKLPAELRGRRITASFLDKIPGAHRTHRYLLPLYPLAVEKLDLGDYDLIISSDSGPVKGIITNPGSTHICYCHSPMRYLWDARSAYARDMGPAAQIIFGLASHYVRNWDYSAAQRVDYFIANSRYVAGRISKYYRRNSVVIHPPVQTAQGFLADKHEGYYLAVGRLVNYKRTDILIDACRRLKRRLVIVGEGPETKSLKKNADKWVEFVGEVDDSELPNIYARCRALLFAAEEDFGLVALEAQAYGRPVIAFGKGGSLETVIAVEAPGRTKEEGYTGVFFPEQTAESLSQAILSFESREQTFNPRLIQLHARKFAPAVFVKRLKSYVEEVMTGAESWQYDRASDLRQVASSAGTNGLTQEIVGNPM